MGGRRYVAVSHPSVVSAMALNHGRPVSGWVGHQVHSAVQTEIRKSGSSKETPANRSSRVFGGALPRAGLIEVSE